jgi:hypothetical protein
MQVRTLSDFFEMHLTDVLHSAADFVRTHLLFEVQGISGQCPRMRRRIAEAVVRAPFNKILPTFLFGHGRQELISDTWCFSSAPDPNIE